MTEYEQVGVISLRDPMSGAFLPAIPLYIRAGDGVPADMEVLIVALTHLLVRRAQEAEGEADAWDGAD